ncbi:MAG: ankyrin repeat domain-containing protein [Smithella sp.]
MRSSRGCNERVVKQKTIWKGVKMKRVLVSFVLLSFLFLGLATGAIADVVTLGDENDDLMGTAFTKAAGKRDLATARNLVEKGADVNEKIKFTGRMVLMKASEKGHIDIVRYLIEKGANVNVNRGGTALMFAAREGYTAIVQAMIKKGADLNATDSTGYTALSLAEARGHADAARVLKDEMAKAGKQNTNATSKLSLSPEDTQLLSQLQPPATEREKKLYLEAKKKNLCCL